MKEATLKKSALVNATARYATIIIQLLFQAILARILTPDDYGVMALVGVFVAFFNILSSMGVSGGIVQHKELTEQQINGIFTFTILIGVVVAAIFAVMFIPISYIYGNPELKKIGVFLSLSVIFGTINTTPNGMMMRDKKFVAIGLRSITVAVITNIIAIIFAMKGFKHYALVIQSIMNAIIIFSWNYLSAKQRLKIRIDMSGVKTIYNFASFQLYYNMVNYFARNLDNLLIGKFMGNGQLGFYDKAYQLMLYPVRNLTFVITPVLHPILSDYQQDKEVIYEKYLKVLKILSIVGVFVTGFCFYSGREIILIMFGDQWVASIPSFKWLSLSLWFQLTASSAGAIYQSLGKTKLMFKSGIAHITVTVILIVVGILSGRIVIVSALVALSLFIKFIIEYTVLGKYGFEKGALCFFKDLKVDFISGLVFLGLMSSLLLINIENILISAIVKFIICGVVYMIMLMVTGQIDYMMLVIPGKFQNKVKKILRRH